MLPLYSGNDLILITGDVIYGKYDRDGEILKAFIAFMESFDIPWAPIYGNHDAESPKGADWQCQQYEEAKNCLFVQRKLTGNGNYTIAIKQDSTIKRMIFMMDSNGCSVTDYFNDHSTNNLGLQEDQKTWLTETAASAKRIYPNMKLTVCFHIQMSHFSRAYEQYGFNNADTQTRPINLDTLSGVADGDFGYLGRNFKSEWYDFFFYDNMIELGTDSFLYGHEHCNSASVVYEGVRYQFGQKSSTYDRANYLAGDGSIVGTTNIEAGEPIMGGTVLKLSKTDSAIKDAYIQYWNK